jgi:hypothetical protein
MTYSPQNVQGALLHVGDRMAAFLEYQKALQLAPDNPDARQGFTRLGGLPDDVAPRR